MEATRETAAVRAAPPAAWGRTLLRQGRRSVRALGQAILPTSLVVWRQPRAALRPGERGQVALTFDDGPAELTPDYLSVLARFGARATFFVVGEACEKYPNLVRAIADAGHELAGHGYTHKRFPELAADDLRKELVQTSKLLPGHRHHTSLVRPPHGAVSLSSTLTSARAGFTTVLWSHDSGDWATIRAEDVTRTFERDPLPAGAIVLFHEGQSWTLEALPKILHILNEAGHELVTVGELLGR
ncbi:MAG TPA: polysaccharide deacetylase family protein [Polyangiaceae bacterium]